MKVENVKYTYYCIVCFVLDIVSSEQEMLQKSQSVDEAQRCYELGQYENVVRIMLQSFNAEKQKVSCQIIVLVLAYFTSKD